MKVPSRFTELCVKAMAVMFICLMVLSLVNMKGDIYLHDSISVFDTVAVEKKKFIGVVESIVKTKTNTVYHVVYQDGAGCVVHTAYTKSQIQKVFIVDSLIH
jgi:hypothetical protein